MKTQHACMMLYTVTLAKKVLVVVLGHNNYNQNNCSWQ